VLFCVGIPSIDGKVCAQTMDSLLAEQLLGMQQGVHFLILWELGCSLIGSARNKIAHRFLETKADTLVFVDADISWKAGELVKLAKRSEPVIGGTYRAKRDDELYHVFGLGKQAGDLYPVKGLPGGFLKIDRAAFEAIKPLRYADAQGKAIGDYFPTGFHRGRFYGEDYGFCRLWRATGGRVWLDPSIILRHHDGVRAYTGDPAAWLKGHNG
jgi:hypothetical protein